MTDIHSTTFEYMTPLSQAYQHIRCFSSSGIEHILLILAFQRLKKEDQEFVVNLGFLVRARLPRATQDPVSKSQISLGVVALTFVNPSNGGAQTGGC